MSDDNQMEDNSVNVTVYEKILLLTLIVVTSSLGGFSIYEIMKKSETLEIGPAISAVGFFMSTIVMTKTMAEYRRDIHYERLYKKIFSSENMGGLVIGIIGLVVWVIISSY